MIIIFSVRSVSDLHNSLFSAEDLQSSSTLDTSRCTSGPIDIQIEATVSQRIRGYFFKFFYNKMRYINLRFTYLLTRLVACLGFAYKGQSSTSRSRPGLAGDGSPPVHGVQE